MSGPVEQTDNAVMGGNRMLIKNPIAPDSVLMGDAVPVEKLAPATDPNLPGPPEPAPGAVAAADAVVDAMPDDLPETTSFVVTSPETVTLAGSSLTFINTYASNVTDAYRTAIVAAEHELQGHFSNPVTLRVAFDFANTGGNVASNNFSLFHVDYATLRSALQTHATSADDTAAVNTLSSLADPNHGVGFFVPFGVARLLSLPGATTLSTDDTVHLDSGLQYTFDPSHRAVAGAYD